MTTIHRLPGDLPLPGIPEPYVIHPNKNPSIAAIGCGLRLTFPDPPLRSMNARDAHWSTRAGHAKGIRLAVAAVARLTRTSPYDKVILDVTLWQKDKRLRDPDNLAPLAKPMIDGLVDAGVIPADDWRHVEQIRYSIRPDEGKPDHHRITIDIIEAS